MIKDLKFIKIQSYIQGSEQLTYSLPYLIICSSMKDLLCFNKLGFKNAEAIAPDSENTLIPESQINEFKKKYKGICVIFDNDEAGIKAMATYHNKFGLPYIKFDMEKDISDSIEKHGIRKIREIITPLLKQTLNV